MRLEQMRQDFTSLPFEDQKAFVLQYRTKRAKDFTEKEANQVTKATRKASTAGPALSDEEKNLCKLLKITQKQFKIMKAAQMETQV